MITQTLLGVIGTVILLVVLLDFLYTAIGAAPVAPLSKYVARYTWAAFTRIMPESPTKHRLSGPVVMTGIALTWIVLVSLGWTLIFQMATDAVVLSENEQPVGPLRDFAYVGHLLSTLGGGPLKPEGTVWLILSVLAGVNGMVILTLSVSFVLSTTTTVARGRGLLTKAPMFEAGSPEINSILIPALADLVAHINAMQFALYYSAEVPERRLPAGLVDLARRLAPYPEQMRRLRLALAPLPGFEAADDTRLEELSDAAFILRLDAWAEGYTI